MHLPSSIGPVDSAFMTFLSSICFLSLPFLSCRSLRLCLLLPRTKVETFVTVSATANAKFNCDTGYTYYTSHVAAISFAPRVRAHSHITRLRSTLFASSTTGGRESDIKPVNRISFRFTLQFTLASSPFFLHNWLISFPLASGLVPERAGQVAAE